MCRIQSPIVYAAMVFLFAFAAASYAGYSGGTGESSTPFEIATVADWQELMNTPADWDKHFVLTADLDLEGIPVSPVGVSYSASFTGVFDGNNYIIRNADLGGGRNVGLFGYVGETGQIENLGVEDASVSGGVSLGGLVGRNRGTIRNCYSTGSVNGDSIVGGLVGYNSHSGTIINCYSTGSVSGTGSQVGGLVGENSHSGTISNCYSTASVSGRYIVGGLAGYNSDSGTISTCHSTGSVGGTSYGIGGLVGENYYGSIIINCYSTSPVSGGYEVGGLVGSNWDYTGAIINCYSTGWVNGNNEVGGLVGYNTYGIITNCYSTGAVSGTYDSVGGLVGKNHDTISNSYATGTSAGDDYVGGLVGENYEGTVNNCYSTGSVSGSSSVGGLVGLNDRGSIDRSFWDVENCGRTTSAGGTGKSTTQMQDINTFLEAGWDFLGEPTNGTCNFWLMPQTAGYPVLSIFNGYIPLKPFGSGTEADPYIITDANELGTVWYRPWACYMMAKDIDLAGINWSAPIVPFFGRVFDGNDYVIHNPDVNMPGSNYAGLFGCLGRDGHIKNLGVEDSSIFGRNYVGGIVGVNYYGTITNCYSTGLVGGDDYLGGLVGENRYYGSISNCYSAGSVTGTGYYVGGLVGENNSGAISNCCSTGSVSGTVYGVGGLVGWNYEGIITRSFWDVNTSGWATSAGGTGKTSAEMQDINTFLEAGWDFVGETANGTFNFWLIPQSGGYPVLSTFNGYAPAEPCGSGTEAEPYIITDANEWGTVWYRPSAHYLLGNDIDLAGKNWTGVVVPFFGGVFAGNDYVIRNADVNMPGTNYVGLFGCLAKGGQIKNLGVEDTSIFGYRYVGGLVGVNYYGTINNCYSTGSVVSGEYSEAVGGLGGENYCGVISNCRSTGSVSGTYYVGGLVGENYYGPISNCYSTGSVTSAGQFAGGLVGRNEVGSISNCYSTGSVSGNEYLGGLVGDTYSGTIDNSYSTSSVSGAGYGVGGLVGDSYRGTIGSSFWDVNTSGWTTSDGGTPKTTEEVKTESTFTSAGWDFIGETANGTEDIWAICEGTNYPRLVWQIPSADWVCPDGVGLEDFGHFGGYWGTGEAGPVNLDGEEGIGFGDLMIFCEEWLRGR